MSKRAEHTHAQTDEPTDVYANSVGLDIGASDLFMEFLLRTPEDPNPEPEIRVHMSIAHAWVMAKLLDRLFSEYRQKGGEITIPDKVLNELGLVKDYKEEVIEPPLPSVELARLAKGSWNPDAEGAGTSIEVVRRLRDEWKN